jgi:hypothetical protein
MDIPVNSIENCEFDRRRMRVMAREVVKTQASLMIIIHCKVVTIFVHYCHFHVSEKEGPD